MASTLILDCDESSAIVSLIRSPLGLLTTCSIGNPTADGHQCISLTEGNKWGRSEGSSLAAGLFAPDRTAKLQPYGSLPYGALRDNTIELAWLSTLADRNADSFDKRLPLQDFENDLDPSISYIKQLRDLMSTCKRTSADVFGHMRISRVISLDDKT